MSIIMYRLYDDEVKAIEPDITEKDIQLRRDTYFAHWLKDKVSLIKLY